MSTTCTALVIPVRLNEALRTVVIGATPDVLQELVGGHLESVSRATGMFTSTPKATP